ncbi:MAG TPA: hypothetical protein VJ577_16885 [Burkholderiaceae bacterium]|nr:hypothetical protein [Burkholderiaceae bacterium]
MTSSTNYIDEPTRQFRDALRLLFVLARAGEAVDATTAPAGTVKVITSQKRLQKIDFWVRNPDHLAHAFLDEYERTEDGRWLRHVHDILDNGEPEIRRDEMLKYMFGAYEPIDTGMAPLISYGLAKIVRHPETHRRWFYLLERGAQIADTMEAELPQAQWYAQRTALIGQFVAGRGGEDLARMQYQEPEYANAPRGETIGSIAGKVRARLAHLEGRHG